MWPTVYKQYWHTLWYSCYQGNTIYMYHKHDHLLTRFVQEPTLIVHSFPHDTNVMYLTNWFELL